MDIQMEQRKHKEYLENDLNQIGKIELQILKKKIKSNLGENLKILLEMFLGQMTSLHLYFHWIILIQGQVILCPFRNILFNFLLKAYMYFKKFE